MIIRRTKGGIFLFLLQAATSYGELFNSNDRCGAQAKGGVGKWPSNYEMNINNYEVDQSDGMEAAVLRCSYDCCNNYNNLAYPCDLAFINFNPNLRDPSIAVCSHYSCYDQFGNFNCQFKNEPYREDFSGEPIFNYASWVYAFSDDLLPLLDSDGAKVKEALKLQGNITSGDGKGLGVYQIEEEITDLNGGNGISGINGIINSSKNPRSLLAQIEGEKEMVAMEKGALAQSKIDKEKANTKLMKILTPLLIVAMVLSLAVATVTMKYKRLKKTIKYDGVKDADYYTKLDPADMAAEQEAQALINGAYDI